MLHSELKQTIDITPPLDFVLPRTIEEIVNQGSSKAGLSAVSSFLSCPEASRLRTLGIRRRWGAVAEDYVDLSEDPLGFGSLIHALRATRIVYGQGTALELLGKLHIDEASRLMASSIFKIYDSCYPLNEEPWDYIGVEADVVTNIGEPERPILRTVRYDSVIRMKDDGSLFSFEAKTAKRSGQSTLAQYTPQSYTHAALWNTNPNLVKKYGQMRGVIFDLILKTAVPKIERIGPHYVSKLQQTRAMEYLRLPEVIKFKVAEDGSYPRMLHNCYGRYKACEYIDLCFEGAHGDYERTT